MNVVLKRCGSSGTHFAVPVDDIVDKLRRRIEGPYGINDLGPTPTRRLDELFVKGEHL